MKQARSRFRNTRKIATVLLAICAPLFLAGCKSELYSNVSEREANEMLAVLMQNGISAQKEDGSEQGVTLTVADSDLADAIGILTDNGLPRKDTDSIGKVFEKGGIMSSPFEERVRYVYALGEEVSKTLVEIDGVLSARVHVVLPEQPSFSEEAKPSSVAVFIKHRHGVDLDFFTPQIRRLVSKAIEGVDYENVTVVLVEAEGPQILASQVNSPIAEVFPGLGIRSSDADHFRNITIIAGVALIVLVLSNIATLFGFARARSALQSHMSGEETDHGG